MSAADNQLKASRAARDEARAALDQRLGAVREALAEQGVKQRVIHDATGQMQDVAAQSLAVAKESRWVIAATGAALVAWLLRRPLLTAGRQAVQNLSNWGADREPQRPWQRLREWTIRKAKP